MPTNKNTAWQLEQFIDSLVFELDKARETLSVKSVNNPLTYAVKDVELDLQVFPEYDGDKVRFVTAGTNERGSSKMTLTLGSITDRQIRETTKEPLEADDITLDEVEDIEPPVKKKLERLGVRSVNDIEKFKKKNIQVKDSDGGDGINFKKLAGMISKARMASAPPEVYGAQFSGSLSQPLVVLRGKNLSLASDSQPRALLNGEPIEVIAHSPNEIVLGLRSVNNLIEKNHLHVELEEGASFELPVTIKRNKA